MNTLKEINELEITVNLDGIEVKRSLKDDLKCDEEHINTYLIENPGKTAYWNALYQKIHSRVETISVALDEHRAEVDRQLREIGRINGKEPKESEIKSLIILDPKTKEIQAKLLEFKEQEGLLKAAIESLRDLRSTLISLSANMRVEMGSGINILKKEYERRAANI